MLLLVKPMRRQARLTVRLLTFLPVRAARRRAYSASVRSFFSATEARSSYSCPAFNARGELWQVGSFGMTCPASRQRVRWFCNVFGATAKRWVSSRTEPSLAS